MKYDYHSTIDDVRQWCLENGPVHLIKFVGTNRSGHLATVWAVASDKEVLVEGHLRLPTLRFQQIDRFCREHLWSPGYQGLMTLLKQRKSFHHDKLMGYVTDHWEVYVGDTLDDVDMIDHIQQAGRHRYAAQGVHDGLPH